MSKEDSTSEPDRITAGPCARCGVMLVGMNACPYCGNEWVGARFEYARVRSDSPSEPLHELLTRYAQPCSTDCEHSQCPLLRELWELSIANTLQAANRTVRPIIEAEKQGEEVGGLMGLQLRSPSVDEAVELKSDIMADRHYLAGMQFGWNCGVTGDREKYDQAAEIRRREIHEALASTSDSGKVGKL